MDPGSDQEATASQIFHVRHWQAKMICGTTSLQCRSCRANSVTAEIQTANRYLAGSIRIGVSGIVLRGSGADTGGTTIRATQRD